MSNYRHLLPAILVAASTVTASAAPYVAKPVNDRAKASVHVVVATVTATEARFETNEFGDRLIISRVRLAVEEAMKGPGTTSMDMDLEGGTVGEITLQVSDLPALRRGDRAVFFLSPGRSGRLVPHLRGQSILKLDAQQRVAGTDVTLAEIRERVRTAR